MLVNVSMDPYGLSAIADDASWPGIHDKKHVLGDL